MISLLGIGNQSINCSSTGPIGLSTSSPFVDVNICVTSVDSVLITGPSGIGKTSFLRVLAGLWPTHKEASLDSEPSLHVHLPAEQLRYLPQRPYLPPCLPGFLTQLLPEELLVPPPWPSPDCARALRFVYLLIFASNPPHLTSPDAVVVRGGCAEGCGGCCIMGTGKFLCFRCIPGWKRPRHDSLVGASRRSSFSAFFTGKQKRGDSVMLKNGPIC